MNATKATVRQTLAIRMQRALWRGRAQRWDELGSVQLEKVVDAVLASCPVSPDAVVLDLGCGSGQVTLSRSRSKRLNSSPRASIWWCRTNAFHHLRDTDKQDALAQAYRWLRPGGRLVVGDMMFGRGVNRRDREIIRSKVRALATRGPAGWWRIIKNAGRFLLRFQEKPLTASAWETITCKAGFTDVTITPVVAEACVMSAFKRTDLPLPEDEHLPGAQAGRDIEVLRSAA